MIMKRLLLVVALAIFSLPAFAGDKGYQQSTSVSTSSAISPPSIPSGGIQSMTMDIEGAGVRIRSDGTDPTSSVGRPIAAGSSFCYVGDPHAVRLIGQSGSPTVNWNYFSGICQ